LFSSPLSTLEVMMRLGICGWSQSGKTTVFDVLTGLGKAAADHAGAGKARLGVAHVADERIDFLAGVFKPKKTTYAAVEYVDLPGLVAGPSAHESNPKVLTDVRQADALIAVVRAFDDPAVPNPFDAIDPLRDFTRLWDELVFADLELVERRIERLEDDAAKPTPRQKDYQMELELLARVRGALEEGKAATTVEMNEAEDKATRGFRFLTAKPVMVAVNLGEEAAGKPCRWSESDFKRPTVCIFGKLELELSALDAEDRAAFMKDLGLEKLAAHEIIRKGYEILDIISFLTVGDKEVHAWTVRRGTTAVEAAGAVHSDMERGFIRAEVTPYDDFRTLGSFKEARAKGKLRLEGRDYVVRDGEIILFRFSV